MSERYDREGDTEIQRLRTEPGTFSEQKPSSRNGRHPPPKEEVSALLEAKTCYLATDSLM